MSPPVHMAESQGDGLSTVGMPHTTVRYIIDGKNSRFTVQAFATGLLSTFAHNPTIAIRDFEGEICFSPEAVEHSSLHLMIHSASLTVTDDVREKDRAEINRAMQEQVLESDSFPEILYESSGLSANKIGEGQYWGTMNGELALHGVTRSQPVSVRIAANEDVLRATGDFSVRQSDYEIRPVTAVGGTIKLKDELKFSFDISARRQT